MPKVVEHAERREQLISVVWEIISRDGIGAATVRRVAEEAGVSVGGLRHYFDSQQGLILFAAQAMADRASARVAAHLSGGLRGPERARALLEELLPLDADRRVEADVWLDCLLRSRVGGPMGELRAQGWAGERHICRLAAADCTGVRAPETIGTELADAGLERLAGRLHVFVDGLTLQAAMYPRELPPARVRETLAAELDGLFGGTAEGTARAR